jgi:outer membrane protein, multidrug efflux system
MGEDNQRFRHRRWKLAAAGFACATLTACSTTPTPRAALPEVDVPAAWAASSPGAAATRARQAPFAEPLLRTLVDDVLGNNTSVESARAALNQARALRDGAAAGLQPTVGGSASAQRNRSGDNPSTSQFRAGLDASWELDVFGAQRAGVMARDADVATAQDTLTDVQVSIAAETALAYVQLRAAQQRLALAEANLAGLRETLQIAGWRAQAGLVSSLDVEQARGAALQTEAQLASLQSAQQQSAHALAVLTGRPPAALQPLLSARGDIPAATQELALAIPADTLRQRPDVRAAESAWRAATERLTQSQADKLPSVRLSGSIGLSALTLGSLTGNGALVAALLGSVSWPVFDGGAADANVRAQQAALQKAGAAYRAAVLGALKDVEDALVALQHDRTRLAALQGAAEASANAALLARQRYDSGLVDFQTVLETQRSLIGTRDSVASAQADIAADHVRLFKAFGGSWERPAAASAPTSSSARP